MTHKTTATTKDWDINDSQFPKLQVPTSYVEKSPIRITQKYQFIVKDSRKQSYEFIRMSITLVYVE